MTTPFGDEYADDRGRTARSTEREAVDRQVAGLRRWQTDPDFGADYLRRLGRRRRRLAVTQVESIDRPDGGTVYVAAGETLVPAIAFRSRAGRAFEEFRGGPVRVVDVDPAGPLVVLRSPGGRRRRTAQELADGPDDEAELNYIVPLGGVAMKAEGGPENTTLTRPFPAVEYPVAAAEPTVVAVIDTGISMERRTDGYLQGLVRSDNVDALDVLPGPPDGYLDAEAGHGSFVAGVVQQVAPTAALRVYKVTGPDGLCTDIDVAAMIRRVAADGAHVINLSLGTATLDDTCPPAMKAAIADVIAAQPGLLIVCAAGNDGNEVPVWPAALAGDPAFAANVVAVAGLNADGGPSDFSGRGAWVSCSAIGEGVASTYVIGTENGELIGDPDPDTFGPNAWAVWTGTSFAAPQVTGAIARRCAELDCPPRKALDSLFDGVAADPRWGVQLTILPGT